jgi:membrane fusion protein (multidrug efflux system)
MKNKDKSVVGQFDDMVVKIKLSDGTYYPEEGVLEFVNNEVDPTAGTISLRATFENKDKLLVPGDFVNVTAISKKPVAVVLVPQEAVSDSTNGTYVWIVDKDNKAQQRFVKISNQEDKNWIVEEGLESGETVIVAGFQRLRPGSLVSPQEKNIETKNSDKKEQ